MYAVATRFNCKYQKTIAHLQKYFPQMVGYALILFVIPAIIKQKCASNILFDAHFLLPIL